MTLRRYPGRGYDRTVKPAMFPSTCDVCLLPIIPPQLVTRRTADAAWIHARCAPGGDDE